MDADEMEWYNDVDDDIPVSIPASSMPALSSSSSAQSLDNFFPPMLQPRKSQISASQVALVSLRKRQLILIMPKQVRSGRLEIITGLAVLHAKSSCPTPMEELSDSNHSDSDGNTARGNKTDDQSGDDEEFDEAQVQEKFDGLRALGDQDREVRLVF
jgi:hypothetical protein